MGECKYVAAYWAGAAGYVWSFWLHSANTFGNCCWLRVCAAIVIAIIYHVFSSISGQASLSASWMGKRPTAGMGRPGMMCNFG